MLLYRLSCCIAGLLLAFSLSAQPAGNRQAVSPEQLQAIKSQVRDNLKQATADTARVRLKMQLAGLEARDNLSEGLRLAKEAVSMAEKTGHPETQARAYFGMGNLYLNANRYDDALEYLNKGLPIAEKIGTPALTESFYNQLGRIYFTRGVYEKALAFYQKSLQALEKMQAPPTRKASVLSQIGQILERTGKHREALDYLQKSATLAEQAQMWDVAGGVWNNIANCYEALNDSGQAEAARAKVQDFRERDKKKAPARIMMKSGGN